MKNTRKTAGASDSLDATQAEQLEIIYHLARTKHGLGTDDFDVTSCLVEAHDLARANQAPVDVFEKQRAGMRIGELLMLYALQENLANNGDAQAAFARGPATKLLFAVTVPNRAWIGCFEAAAVAVIGDIVRRRCMAVEGVSFTRIDHRYGYASLDPRAIDGMRRGHVVILADRDEAMPDLAAEILDAKIVLEVTPTALLAALTDAGVPHAASALPDAADVCMLDPETIDMVVERYGSAESIASAIRRAAAVVRARPPGSSELMAKATGDKPKLGRYGIAPTELLRPMSPRVEDLHGYDVAAAWARDFVLDLQDYREGRIGWSDVDAGGLLHGPPGTGKTTFAKALAASAELPLIATSYSDWQSQGEAHGGTLVKTLRQRFQDASDNAPCILFIDEIDAIPARGHGGRNEEWWRAILVALLECMDGIVRRDGVVVLAACNDPSGLDPALVRSGRLDRRFYVGLPDEESLAGIFEHHMPGVGSEVIAPVATALAGSISGADVSRFSREARRLARRERREVTGADLLAVALPPDPRPEGLRWRVAVHEAGHAIAHMSVGLVPHSISLVETSMAHGLIRTAAPASLIGMPSEIDARVVMLLAGRAAEEVVFGDVSGAAANDLAQATTIVTDVHRNWGLGSTLVSSGPVSSEVIEAHLRRLYVAATELVGQHRGAVEALARMALERRVLGSAALATFAAEHGFVEGRS